MVRGYVVEFKKERLEITTDYIHDRYCLVRDGKLVLQKYPEDMNMKETDCSTVRIIDKLIADRYGKEIFESECKTDYTWCRGIKLRSSHIGLGCEKLYLRNAHLKYVGRKILLRISRLD